MKKNFPPYLCILVCLSFRIRILTRFSFSSAQTEKSSMKNFMKMSDKFVKKCLGDSKMFAKIGDLTSTIIYSEKLLH